MTEEKINIAIAKSHGWKGVPFKQIWHTGSRGRYWRSEIPKEIHEAFKEKKTFPIISSCSCRWLCRPDGSPVMELREGPMVNNYATRRWSVIHTGFNTSEFPDANTYAFGVNDPPEIEPNLDDFVKWLPDYYNDLNAIREVVLSLSNTKFHKWASELSLLVLGTKQKAPTRQFLCASAEQWAIAYVKMLGLLDE